MADDLPTTSVPTPTDEELLAFYTAWFEANYCVKPSKPSVALLGFARAVLNRYGAATADATQAVNH